MKHFHFCKGTTLKPGSQVECKCLQPLYRMGNQPIAPLLGKEAVLFVRLDVMSDVFVRLGPKINSEAKR